MDRQAGKQQLDIDRLGFSAPMALSGLQRALSGFLSWPGPLVLFASGLLFWPGLAGLRASENRRAGNFHRRLRYNSLVRLRDKNTPQVSRQIIPIAVHLRPAWSFPSHSTHRRQAYEKAGSMSWRQVRGMPVRVSSLALF